jgi:hypothetical protein
LLEISPLKIGVQSISEMAILGDTILAIREDLNPQNVKLINIADQSPIAASTYPGDHVRLTPFGDDFVAISKDKVEILSCDSLTSKNCLSATIGKCTAILKISPNYWILGNSKGFLFGMQISSADLFIKVLG